jgi:hypothetical protein
MIKPRLLASILIPLFIVAGLSTLMVYGLPIFVKSKILTVIQQETGRKASLTKCQFTILPFSVQLQNVALQETDGKPFASVANIHAQINILQSLSQSTLVIDKLAITKPVVHIVKYKNGTFNFDNLLKNQTDKQQISPFFPFTITSFSLSEGNLSWAAPGSKETFQPINLTVNNLSTFENKKCPLDLQLSVESGGKLAWQGEFSLNPLLSNGHIKLNNFKLQDLSSLIFPESILFSLNGNALLDTDYQASYDKMGLTLNSAKTKIELHDFQYAEKHQKPLVIKAAYSSLETDLKITYLNNAYSLTAKKSKINVHNFNFSEMTPNNRHIKAESYTHETDINIHYVDDNWQFLASKSRINLQDFDFSESTPNKILLKTANINHETDFKISSAHDDWQFMVKQSKMAASNTQFSMANLNNLAIKTAMLRYETDVAIQSIKQIWQLSANNAKIDAQELALAYSNAKFKTPGLFLQTGVDSLFAENTHLTVKQGKINSHQLELFEKNQNKPLISVPDIAVQGVDFNLQKQELKINAITADRANVFTGLNTKGFFDYQKLFTGEKTVKADKIEPKLKVTSAKSIPSWIFNIDQIALTKLETTFEDQTQIKPVVFSLKPIDFKLTGFSNKTGLKLPFQLNASVNKTGSIFIDGNAIIEPFSAQLVINTKDIELRDFQVYFEKLAHLDIIDGKFATNGKLSFAMPEKQPLDLKYTGDSTITEFTTRDQKRHRDFIKWQILTLKGLAVDLQKNSYTADNMVIDKPYVKLTIKKDKTLNFSDIFITHSQPPSKSTVKTDAQLEKNYFKLNKLIITDGTSDFSDRSLILPFSTQIKSLYGGASEISSDSKSSIKISLKGTVYDLAPVDIDGYINPYQGNFDLFLNFKGMPMPLISSYMVEFAGYKIEKGKMSLKLNYKVVDKELTASNTLFIDQFELGEKVDNPKAVSLPLEMAIALLKDSDGKITIDIPIKGSLNDPQFSIGSIISEALGNTISNVVRSPFRVLASLFGNDETSISTINFKAGTAVLDKAGQNKLSTLAKLLKERSLLILDVKGTAFLAQDWPAMKEAVLYNSLKKTRAEEINKLDGGTKIQAEFIELSDADYKRLLAEQFIEKFPNLAKKSLFGTPELIDAKTGDFYEVAKKQLSASLKNEQVRLKELASQRSRAIASYLVQKGGVPNEQVFILAPAVDPKRESNEINSILSLKSR